MLSLPAKAHANLQWKDGKHYKQMESKIQKIPAEKEAFKLRVERAKNVTIFW